MLRYDVVDVFTDRAYAGNALAVVHGGEGLSTQQMQSIAREFNLSETAFPAEPAPAERAEAHYRVRIFTPGAEVPFAGHPSIGTAWVLHREGRLPSGAVGQHSAAGLVQLQLPAGEGPVELSAPPRGVSASVEPDAALAAVGLAPAAAVGGLRVAGCGLDFGYLQVHGDALDVAGPSASVLTGVRPRAGGDPLGGLCVYRVDSGGQPLTVTARVFCPDVGVLEDPGTGSAALGLGLVLVADGLLRADNASYVVEQGAHVGRPSTLYGRVSVDGDTVTRCHVAGSVVPVASGTITPPPA